MKYHEVTQAVIDLCQNSSLNFQAKGDRIQHALDNCSTEDIIDHLDYAGVIPECYGHDSTEEKVFAKYCDSLLACAWRELGLDAALIQERADAADVEARGDGYSIVGDAKAFRLSRTAKNQKDFKVEALNQWRKDGDYACLVSPLYQYPSRNSQIYLQAVRYNVCIISYTHLSFMIKNEVDDASELRMLWEVAKGLKVNKSADQYWGAVNSTIQNLTGMTPKDWQKELSEVQKRLPAQAQDQIDYWNGIKSEKMQLSKEGLVDELIKALNIQAKIEVIKRTAGRKIRS